MYLCESPPGFQDTQTLKKEYPLVDVNYESIWELPLPREGYGDGACVSRLRKTLDAIIEKYVDAGIKPYIFLDIT